MTENQSGIPKEINNTDLINAVHDLYETAVEDAHKNFALQKVRKMTEITLEALSDAQSLARVLHPRKSAFRQIRKRNRRPMKKLRQAEEELFFAARSYARAMRMQFIISQPMPKINSGTI